MKLQEFERRCRERRFDKETKQEENFHLDKLDLTFLIFDIPLYIVIGAVCLIKKVFSLVLKRKN